MIERSFSVFKAQISEFGFLGASPGYKISKSEEVKAAILELLSPHRGFVVVD